MLRFGCILVTTQDSEFDTLAHWLCLRWLPTCRPDLTLYYFSFVLMPLRPFLP